MANITKEQLKKDLASLGIQKGMNLEVHSALSSFGYVEGGAETVISALMELLTEEGTLVMPSFNHGEPYEKGDLFDIRKTRTKNGKIPDTFWRMEGVLRGMNPTHSYAAWGKNAKRYTESQQTETGLGKGSPLNRMYDDGAYVLLLGTGYHANTFHHFVEQNEGVHCLNQIGEIYPVIDENGNQTTAHTWSWRGGSCPVSNATGTLYEEDMKAVDKRMMIGNSLCILYAMQEGYPIIAKVLNAHCGSCTILPRKNQYSISQD